VDEIKTEFLTTAAHELRTPMASIMGFSELLLDDQDESTRKEFLGIIHAQCSAMAAILDEFLDLARIEERRDQDFEYQYNDLKGLCLEIIKSLAVPSGRMAPEVDVPVQSLHVLVDVGKLRRAILNVLTNAYKYSPNGGRIQFKLELQSHKDQKQEICIVVIDEGIGMRPDELARVFERFYRADTSGKIPGTGLGMSLVKEVVQLHGGRVDIESEFGRGTTVRLYLPLKRS
jgi:signal transduction histidine kinase